VLVGAKEDWLRHRFGTEALSQPPAYADRVYVLAAGRRRERLALQRAARKLQRPQREPRAVLRRAAKATLALVLSLISADPLR
jgi:hypothetical protein